MLGHSSEFPRFLTPLLGRPLLTRKLILPLRLAFGHAGLISMAGEGGRERLERVYYTPPTVYATGLGPCGIAHTYPSTFARSAECLPRRARIPRPPPHAIARAIARATAPSLNTRVPSGYRYLCRPPRRRNPFRWP